MVSVIVLNVVLSSGILLSVVMLIIAIQRVFMLCSYAGCCYTELFYEE